MGIIDWLHREEPATAGTTLESRVIAVLRSIFDPEIPVNIYDLGLIYALEVDEEQHEVHIRMTLTAAACPVAHTFPGTVGDAVLALDGVDKVEVELVWEPPWSRDMMSEAARLELGLL